MGKIIVFLVVIFYYLLSKVENVDNSKFNDVYFVGFWVIIMVFICEFVV